MITFSRAIRAPWVAGHMFFKLNFEGQLLFALWSQWVWRSCGPTLIGSLSVLFVNIHACWTSVVSHLNWANSWKVSQKAWVRKLVFWLLLCVLDLVKLYFFIFETNTPYVPKFIVSPSNVLFSLPLLGIGTVSTAVTTSYASQMMSAVCREPRNPDDFHYRRKTTLPKRTSIENAGRWGQKYRSQDQGCSRQCDCILSGRLRIGEWSTNWVIFRNICMYRYVYSNKGKKGLEFEEGREGVMRWCRGRKGKGKRCGYIIISKIEKAGQSALREKGWGL